MPRTGVNYETIKRTAIKLLSYGRAFGAKNPGKMGTGQNPDRKKLTSTAAKSQDKLNKVTAIKPKKTRKQNQKLAELEI